MEPSEYYRKANLKGNPFRSAPSFADDPRAKIWVGYDRQKRQLEKYLTRTLSDQVGNANFLMIYGSYGTGKSHSLLWARHRILHEKKSDYDSVCYFIPTLRQDKGKLTFAGAYLTDIVEKSDLLSDLKSFQNFLKSCIAEYRSENEVEHSIHEEDIVERLIKSTELFNFAKKIVKCQSDQGLMEVVAPKGLADYQAVVIFTRLVNLFVHEMYIADGNTKRFKKGAYLFIDEVDDLLRSTVKETRDVNDILRHLYDNCPNSFCMIIAFSAEITEFSAMFMDYILERIQRQIELGTLNVEDTIKFTYEILNSNRVNEDSKLEYFPFEESAIDAIVSNLTEITPRRIVKAMQLIIEEARLAGHDPDRGPITVEFLDNHEILEEVLEGIGN